MKQVYYVLDYVTLHPNAFMIYSRSDTILVVHSDAFYNIETKACSQAEKHFFLSTFPGKASYTKNKPILVQCSIQKKICFYYRS